MKLKHLAALLGLLIMVYAPGCASQYHRHSDCCSVNCRYCEPGPLPYRHYPGCACHSKPGARYLSVRPVRMSQSESPAAEAVVNEELDSTETTEELDSPVEAQKTIDTSWRSYDDGFVSPGSDPVL